MLEWCRISYINRVREDTDETQNYVLWHAPKKVGRMLGVCSTNAKQQTHMHSTSRSKRSSAQQIKAITSPAQPRKAEQKFSQAKPSMRASNTKHTRPKTQSIRLAYHFNSFRVGCVHTSCRALPLRLTVCLYLSSCPQSSLLIFVSYNAGRRLEEILG